MRHHATRALYAYWNELRAGRRAPRRLEIQPARLGGLLVDTFVLERTARSDFRFRLAGTRVSSWFGGDLRARDFLSCWGAADRAMLEHHLSAISDHGRAGVFTGEALVPAGATAQGAEAWDSAAFELVVLPLVHTGHAIDRLLCLLVPLEDAAPGAGTPAYGLKLLAAEEVWPDGVPQDPVQPAEHQRPLHPNVRMARIVRQGRRQFRVYQGGRVEDAAHEESERP